MNNLRELFYNNTNKNLVDKWDHYIEIYEEYFNKYIGKQVVILEIGVYQGGSLNIWKNYFGPNSRVIGVDVNPDCKKFEQEGIEIHVGSQEDENFLSQLKKQIPKVDILIDDGGHTMKQQNTTFKLLFDHVQSDGLYICEDTHSSYWMSYGGFIRNPDSFIERSKNLIDSINKWHYSKADYYTKNIKGIHFYNSLVIFEKGKNEPPTSKQIGIDNNVKNLVKLKSGRFRLLFEFKVIIKRLFNSLKRS